MGIFRRLSGKKLSPDINIDDDEDSDADPDASRTENPREKNKGRYQQRIMEQQSLPSSEQQEEVDLAPGVFHKKGKQELHMGHKPSPVTSAMPTNAREPSSHPPVVIISGKEPQTLNQPALLPPPPPLSGNGTSSTALWIASADSSSRSPTKNKAAGSPSSKTKAQHKNYQMPESAAADDGDGDDQHKGGFVGGQGWRFSRISWARGKRCWSRFKRERSTNALSDPIHGSASCGNRSRWIVSVVGCGESPSLSSPSPSSNRPVCCSDCCFVRSNASS
mmetsp:Transcript_7021/g.20405  ORF Transcript_7021/g.20405 Transcript_7021/m.20405 type:complete len:277 (+) Transcript_7021:195-1025(+)